MRTHHRIAATLVPAAALALLTVAPAIADAPVHTGGYVDTTKTFGAGSVCAFPIVRHSYGVESETTKTMQDGTLRNRFYVSNFTYILTNPATGKSLTAREGGQFTLYSYADGTVVIVITGNDALFTAPGVGFIAAQNGRYVETDLPDGSATVTVDTGHFDTGFDAALCAALS